MRTPTPGRIVLYKSKTGYVTPAIVAVTLDTLLDAGVQRFHESEGREGVPPLGDESHVHLVVFSAGLSDGPSFARDGRDSPLDLNAGGTYREWNVPPACDGSAEGREGIEWMLGSWAWPPRAPAPEAPRPFAGNPVGEAAVAFAELCRTAARALAVLVEEAEEERREAAQRPRRGAAI